MALLGKRRIIYLLFMFRQVLHLFRKNFTTDGSLYEGRANVFCVLL